MLNIRLFSPSRFCTKKIGPGEVSYHPSNVLHGALAVEDTVAISFKNIVAPGYPATKTL